MGFSFSPLPGTIDAIRLNTIFTMYGIYVNKYDLPIDNYTGKYCSDKYYFRNIYYYQIVVYNIELFQYYLDSNIKVARTL